MTVGRPVQLFALVALLAALGGGATLMLHKSQAAKPIVIEPAARHAAKPRPRAVVKPAPTPAATKPKPAPSLVASNGLPMSLAAALRRHAVVVVSLFDPQAPTDAIAFAEARAGAKAAGVGFLAVSTLDNAVAGPLTAVLPSGELLPQPGLLIYRRPDLLVQRVDGFLDSDSVAQAAVSARTAPPLK